MDPRKNVLSVCKGEYFEISMMSNEASTGYCWCISEINDPVLFIGSYDQEVGERGAMVGAPHKKVYNFIAGATGTAKVVFKLLRPWLPDEIIATHEYLIEIDDSHTQDELEKFVSEDKFPKTPVLKYGFIPVKAHNLPKVPLVKYGYFNNPNIECANMMYGVPYSNSCAQTPQMPYGVYSTYNRPTLAYGIYSGDGNCCDTVTQHLVAVAETDERCLLKYGSPYNSTDEKNSTCNVKYGFMVNLPK